MCKKLFDFFSFVSTRILKACPKHDKDVHGIYCDANNLYGHWSVHLHRKIGKCILNLCRQIQICNVFNCIQTELVHNVHRWRWGANS